jgi:hypothetical protein
VHVAARVAPLGAAMFWALAAPAAAIAIAAYAAA